MNALDGMRPELLIPVVAIVGGMLTAVLIVGTISVTIYLRISRRDQMDYDLKREMVDRGMSADDIERVIKAGPAAPGRTHSDWHYTETC